MIMHTIMGIDPGTSKTGYIVLSLDEKNIFRIIGKDHADNYKVRRDIVSYIIKYWNIEIVIESIVSYGMPMGQTTIDTAIWIGRYLQIAEDFNGKATLLTRPDVKLNLCNSKRAKDKNVTQALKNRFGDIGTKASPGRLYDLKDGLVKGGRPHVWSALAIAVTYADKKIGELK